MLRSSTTTGKINPFTNPKHNLFYNIAMVKLAFKFKHYVIYFPFLTVSHFLSFLLANLFDDSGKFPGIPDVNHCWHKS